ncbi:hypothetical protein [[Eubacterium] cellulosolvens]
MSIYIALLILILLGLALAFFGKRIMETMAFIIGAILGVAIALWLAPSLYARYFSTYTSAEVCLIIAVIVGALIGGFLGRSLMYGMISFFVASIFSATAYYLTGNYLVSLITFFVVLIIMWFLVEKFLAVMTALLGGCMVGAGVMMLTTGSLGGLSIILFIIIAALLTVFGARYQLQND